MKNTYQIIFIVLASAIFINCSSQPIHSSNDQSTTASPSNSSKTTSIGGETTYKVPNKNSDEISVMTLNVENLFDTSHDKGTEDFTYLPLSQKKKNRAAKKFCDAMSAGHYKEQCFELDWSNEKLNSKLKNISELIQSVDNGRGPDNILFAEVENIKVLRQLVKKNLKNLGYKTVELIEGPDLRGIDVGFVSKFPIVGKSKLHIIPFADSDPEQLKRAQRSRGILEVTIKAPNKKNITFLSAHFPSQSNPTEWRAQAVQFAKGLMTKYQKAGRSVIFGGDLNIIASEEASHFYFKNELSQVGDVSHLVGCKHCPGSYNYRGDWSFLDVLVFSKNLKELGFELMPETIHVVQKSLNTKTDGSPKRFDAKTGTGVTDHLPLYARIKIK